MRTTPKVSLPLLAAALALTLTVILALSAGPASAQGPVVPTVPRGPAPVVAPRPVGNGNGRSAVSPAAYWGPARPAAPKRKPNAVRRLFNRVGTFLGADEEMGSTPAFRDPTTGRTNTGGSKPFMKPSP